MAKSIQYEFKGLSSRAQTILAGDESYDTEFKEEMAGLKPVDIVAFANSERGGTILVGIKDSKIPDGRQQGEIVGCHISDEAKISVISKAESCVPAINIEIFLENSASKAFYRIEIAAGKNKPYCTSGGKYKIRGDGRNLPMGPPRLLQMFVDIEGQKFYQTFHDVTSELEENLSKKIAELTKKIDESRESVEKFHNLLNKQKIDQDTD